MKFTNKSLIGTVAVIAIATAAYASTQSTLQTTYDKIAKVMKTRNFPAIKKVLMENGTKDFKMIEKGGQSMGANDALKMMESQFKMMSSMPTYTCKVTKVVEKGNGADAWVTNHMVMVLKPMGKMKKGSTIDLHSTSKDHWVKMGGKWMMQSMTTLSETATMDGKKFDPSMGGK